MRIVAQVRNGAPLTDVRALTAAETSLLQRWYEDGHVPAVGDDHPLTSLFGALWQAHHWLECGCRDGACGAPLLHVRRTADRKYTLVRMAGRTEHGLSCPFYWEPGAIGRRSLADLTRALITTAGLDQLTASQLRRADLAGDQYRRLRLAARQIEVVPGIPLHRHFGTHHNDCAERSRCLAGSASQWPAGTAPTAYLLLCADRHDGHALHVGSTRIEVRCMNADEACEVAGPFLALIELVLQTDRSEALPRRCYLQPVASRQRLLPVRSVDQRALARRLADLLAWLLARHGVDARLQALRWREDLSAPADFRISRETGDQHTDVLVTVTRSGEDVRALKQIERVHRPIYCDGNALHERSSRDSSRFGRMVAARLLASSPARRPCAQPRA